MKKLTRMGIIIWIMVGGACGGSTIGGGALPQTSIPAPTATCDGSDCITVSAPNSQGLVTITGSRGSVPNSAIVIVTLEEETASVTVQGGHWAYQGLQFLSGLVCRDAQAQAACFSNLPRCATDFDGDACQVPANADGSFLILLPAEIGEDFALSYLDPANACLEIETLEGNIDDSFIPLFVEGEAMGTGGSYVFVAGVDSNGHMMLAKSFLGEDPVTAKYFALDVDGNPRELKYIAEVEGGPSLLVLTDQASFIAQVLADQALSESLEVTELDSGASIVSNAGAVQNSFFINPNLLKGCDLPASVAALSGETVNRIFMASDVENATDERALLKPLALIDDADINVPPKFRPITYDFSLLAQRFPGLANASLASVGDVLVHDGVGVFLARFGARSWYLMQFPVDSVFCGNAVDEASMASMKVVELPTTLTNPGRISYLGDGLYLIPEPGDSSTVLADLPNERANANPLSLLHEGESHFTGIGQVVNFTDAAGDQWVFGIGSGPFLASLQLSGDGEVSALFLDEIEGDNIIGIFPVGISIEGHHLIILDGGLDGDGFSLLRHIELK